MIECAENKTIIDCDENKTMKELIKKIRSDINNKLNQFNGDHQLHDTTRKTDMKSIKRKLNFISKKM
jgi:hypothetical protein